MDERLVFPSHRWFVMLETGMISQRLPGALQECELLEHFTSSLKEQSSSISPTAPISQHEPALCSQTGGRTEGAFLWDKTAFLVNNRRVTQLQAHLFPLKKLIL